jgi:hypothetical protein
MYNHCVTRQPANKSLGCPQHFNNSIEFRQNFPGERSLCAKCQFWLQ